ncbi:DUF2079 domain-containing protein [Phycicoccus sonneratiae]|uniref:DUF2079 domain-containing protein n=1 Tax=Phycicoccus sonneratiae TaxID=2807628 RepID=A0ABS2CFV4_9MICO|nr:DUF2079 domain-containing protein [Phycicoccus sonneraticus]MBM6398777.1 DUF2079 domain-containing protein [Phycicoccus sonneraticus]
MSAPTTTRPPAPPSLDRHADADAGGGRSLRDLLRHTLSRRLDRRGGAVVLLPLLLLVAVVHRVGMYSAPQRIDDEGTYVAQAWAVFHLGELTHYTYWYDHPPLGWLQIAGWTELTGGFDRAPNAVGAGRELMLVLAVVSAALLWLLARRLGLPRWGAGVAVALFGLSPLAVQFHRTVYLDNVATPWVLGALVLALDPRRRLAAFAGSAVCLGVASLSKETSLLVLPLLGWLLWTRAGTGTRRYTVAVSATLFALLGGFYALFALLKGEVVPGADRTSLLGGMLYQVGGRESSGSIFDPESLGHRTVSIWLQLDTVGPVLAVLATLVALLSRRLRPFALTMLLLLLVLVRPGYLPVPFVVVLVPFGALMVAGAATLLWRRRPSRLVGRPVHRAGGVALVAAAALAVGVAAPGWAGQLRGLLIAPLDQPMTDATAWIARNVPVGDRILTDDALWVDLVEQGRDRGDVVWFYKPDTDPDVPRGADAYRWVVSTDSVRSDPRSFPTLAAALERGIPAATFGTGERRVDVLRVGPEGTDGAGAEERRAAAAAAGQQLVANPAVRTEPAARDALLSGRVDPRLLALLASSAARYSVTLDDLPQPPEEEAAGAPRRTVRITAVDGRPAVPDGPAAALAAATKKERASFAAQVRFLPAAGGTPPTLTLTYPMEDR